MRASRVLSAEHRAFSLRSKKHLETLLSSFSLRPISRAFFCSLNAPQAQLLSPSPYVILSLVIPLLQI